MRFDNKFSKKDQNLTNTFEQNYSQAKIKEYSQTEGGLAKCRATSFIFFC
jgi:hypothetical protein